MTVTDTTNYLALTFDSQTVYTNSFRLGSGLLKELTSLSDKKFPVVLSQVVMAEIAKGFHHYLREEIDRLRTTQAKLHELGIANHEHPKFADTSDDPQDIAKKRLDLFWKHLGATPISPDLVPVSKALELYFSERPPFRSKGKKAEFPDAIALLSLEAYARREGQKILAISGDKDWADFCETSDWIDLVPTVREALKPIFKQIDAQREQIATRAINRAVQLVGEINAKSNVRLASEFKAKLAEALALASVEGEANGPYEAQGDQVEFLLKDYELDTSESAIGFATFSQRDEVATVELPGRILVDASAFFSLLYWDGVDREYLDMGSSRETISTWVDTRLIVRIKMGELPEIDVVELVELPDTLDFGYVESSNANDHYFSNLLEDI